MTTRVAQSDRQRLVFAPHFRSLNLPPGTGIFTIWSSVFVLFPGFAFQHPVSRLELAYEFAGRLTTTVGLRWRALDTTSYAEAIWPLAVLAVVRVGF